MRFTVSITLNMAPITNQLTIVSLAFHLIVKSLPLDQNVTFGSVKNNSFCEFGKFLHDNK